MQRISSRTAPVAVSRQTTERERVALPHDALHADHSDAFHATLGAHAGSMHVSIVVGRVVSIDEQKLSATGPVTAELAQYTTRVRVDEPHVPLHAVQFAATHEYVGGGGHVGTWHTSNDDGRVRFSDKQRRSSPTTLETRSTHFTSRERVELPHDAVHGDQSVTFHVKYVTGGHAGSAHASDVDGRVELIAAHCLSSAVATVPAVVPPTQRTTRVRVAAPHDALHDDQLDASQVNTGQ